MYKDFDRYKSIVVIFSRDITGVENKAYKYYPFNHVSIWHPSSGEIWENVGNGIGFTQASSDSYMDLKGMQVVIPFVRTDACFDFRDAQKYCEGQYSNCVTPIRNILVRLGILEKHDRLSKNYGVLDLFWELKDYVITTEEAKEL